MLVVLFDFKLSSNPLSFGSTLLITSNYIFNDDVKVNIYCQKGKRIFRKTFKGDAKSFSIGNPFQTTGVYLVNFNTGKTVISRKIIVV